MPTSPILKRAPFRHNSPVQPAAMTSSSVFVSLRSTPTRSYPNVFDTSSTIWSRSVSGSSVELIFCATRCSRYRSSMYDPAEVLLALTAGSRFRRRGLHAAPEKVGPAADALGRVKAQVGCETALGCPFARDRRETPLLHCFAQLVERYHETALACRS